MALVKNSFLLCSFLVTVPLAMGQAIPYGNNPKAGHYINIEGTTLYYETYGSGTPLLLLHGDTFGYIDEFDQYLPLLAQHFKVIAVGMRGHGKSEIGKDAFSYALFASDAIAILEKESSQPALVLGFSAGAITAYYLAAYYPEHILKVVAMGGMVDPKGYLPGVLEELGTLTEAACTKMLPELVAARKELMPKPDSYGELLDRLKESWLQPQYMDREKVAQIRCSVLSIGGDSDHYIDPKSLVDIHDLIPNSQLAILPHCGHVGLILRPEIVNNVIIPFLEESGEAFN